VSVFPKLAVCLDVAFTEFTVPEKELRVLVQGNPVQGAVVLAENLAGRPKILIGDVVMHNYAMVLKPFTFGASPKSNEPTYRSGTFTSSYVLVDHF
jgi:hypothetical protein